MSPRQDPLDQVEPLVRDLVAPRAAAVDAEGSFPSHTIDGLRQAGLLGLLTPTEHGGLGGSYGDAAVVVERIARACGSSAMVTCMHYAGAAVLAVHGSPGINQRVAGGEELCTLAFSESGSRSHFWAPLSTARRDGEQVLLDAKKSWVTSAHHATAIVWSSQPLDAEGASTLWLVRGGSAGLQAPPAYDGLGLRGNDSTPMTARDLAVAPTDRLGPDGGGFDLMMGIVLPVFQLMNAACSVGLMEGALGGAAAHVSGAAYPHLGGTTLAELPTVRAYLAKARTRADMARALWQDSIVAVEAQRPDAMLRVLQCKAAAGDAALDVVATAMRVCGGAAYRRELGVERFFRDAQAASVMAPTSDVLYDFVGKALTGLDLF